MAGNGVKTKNSPIATFLDTSGYPTLARPPNDALRAFKEAKKFHPVKLDRG